MNGPLHRTVFFDRHADRGAQMASFSGWEMPLHYDGIVAEHLATRRAAGLFDVCHMGRFAVKGAGALAFLQHVLSSNAGALEVGRSQYTLLPNERGGAIDDAWLYRFRADTYLLVVNAANHKTDWQYLKTQSAASADVELTDVSREAAMVSLQGPRSEAILEALIRSGRLPEKRRNALSTAVVDGVAADIARTGYTGEPVCFELFLPLDGALRIWDRLIESGVQPVGLGARDTLRLEAGLPLYGHELGRDPEDREIPVFACPPARFAVSLSPIKKDFIGREALQRQSEALKSIDAHFDLPPPDLPRRILPITVLGRGIARAGDRLQQHGRHIGWITSGTMVPYWKSAGSGARFSGAKGMRAIGLALIDSNLPVYAQVDVEIRKKRVPAMIVPYHLYSQTPPIARPVVWEAPPV